MPFGPGTYPGEGGASRAGPAHSPMGVPIRGVDNAAPRPDPQALSETMKMLKGGQVGSERFLAVLEVLMGQILPMMQQQQSQAPQQQQQDPQQSIASLLGG